MRSILVLIALTCTLAFSQPATPPPLRLTPDHPTPQVCAIPLLNVRAPGNPVPMPTLKPITPQSNANPLNAPFAPRPTDHMSAVGLAPACPADFGHAAPPATAPPAKP